MMTQRQSDVLWFVLFTILLALFALMAMQACGPVPTLPASTTTPTASDTPPPFVAPTPEAWQWCVVTAPLRVRADHSLQSEVLRMLAVDDTIAIDANRRPVVADGYRWFALVEGGWVAEGWMICG